MLENIVKGKRLDNSEWIIGYYWEGGQRSFIIAHDESAMLNEATSELLIKVHEVDSRTVCRCTGKPDKYDRILFDNDLVKLEREGEEDVIHVVRLKSSSIEFSGAEGGPNVVAEVCGLMFESGNVMLLPGVDEDGVPDYRKMEIVGNVLDDVVVMKTSSDVCEEPVVDAEEVEDRSCECQECVDCHCKDDEGGESDEK